MNNEQVLARESKRHNRLNFIKNELEARRIESFEQIFSVISETRMAIELGISFYTLRKKVKDPTEFTISEMMRLATLFHVKYDVMSDFILEKVKATSKSPLFQE